MRVAFDHLSREELDWQLSPSKSARDAAGVLQRLETETEELATAPGVRCTLDVAYGPGPRQKMDLYRPTDTSDPVGCLVFIHGGFWQRGSKMWSGFPARCLTGNNWALVGVGYTLAPEASLTQIVDETALALSTLARRAGEFGLDRDRIVLAGHSAGAHLTAAILSGMGGEDAAQLPARAVLISGVYDLAPIAASYVNDAVGLVAADVPGLSPLYRRPLKDVPVHLLIGSEESDAFHAQTNALRTAWREHLSQISLQVVPGCDHFDILDELRAPDSPTGRFILEAGG